MKNDLSMYDTYAADWWKPKRSFFRSLQTITEFRLKQLRTWVPEVRHLKILDVGCGGGLMLSPLTKEGAKGTGVDISHPSLCEAAAHSAAEADFLQSDARNLPFKDRLFDLVIIADVLDHLPDYELVVCESKRVLRSGGLIYINTINRTLLSKLLAIYLGEGLGLIPRGTHDAGLFIKPKELEDVAKRLGLKVVAWQGERPQLLNTVKKWAIHFAPTNNLSVAYSVLLRAPIDESL